MAEIIGLGVTPMDRWGYENRNIFQLPGNEKEPYTGEPIYKTVSEWIAEDRSRTMGEFWGAREAKLNANAKAVFENNVRKGGFPLDAFAKRITASTDHDIQQMITAMPSWDALMDLIKSGNGTVYGIDIETFGDISKGKGIYGITEIGLNEAILHDGGRRSVHTSIAVGIDMNQRKYLEDLVDRFEQKGWNNLTEAEQVSLTRMSKYGGEIGQRFETVTSNLLGGKSLTVVKNLLPDSVDADRMREGISNLSDIYSKREFANTHIEEVIKPVMGFIDNNKNSLFYAANGQFDFNGLKRLAEKSGITVPDSYDKVASESIDIIRLVRAAAAADGQSVAMWSNNVYGKRGNATVDSLLDVFRIPGSQLHHSGSDLSNEANILFEEENLIYEMYRDAILEKGMEAKDIDPENTLYYIKRGQFNKVNADDFAYVPDKTVKGGYRTSANYAITEEFWKIDTEKSGYISVNDEEKFRLVLTNQADIVNDIEPTRIVLTGDTAEDVHKRLEYMTEAFSEEGLTGDFKTPYNRDIFIKNQQTFHYKDMGRREFDRMFNVTDVRLENGKEIGGYNALIRNLEIEKDLSAWEKMNGNIASTHDSKEARQIYNAMSDMSFKRAVADAQASFANGEIRIDSKAKNPQEAMAKALEKKVNELYKEYMPFKSDYDAQAFVGMRTMLADKRVLLEDILKHMDTDDIKALNNMDKTIMLKKAYDSAIDVITEKHILHKGSEEHYKNLRNRALSDIIDIDVLVDDNKYSRINGYNRKTITDDLTKEFKKMDANQIKAAILDLDDRGVFGNTYNGNHIDMVASLLDSVDNLDVTTKKTYASSLYFLAQDVSYGIVESDNYQSLLGTESGYGRHVKSISKQMGRDERMRFIKSKGNKTYGFDAAFKSSKNDIDDAIKNVVSAPPKTTYNTKKMLTEDQINIMANRLNIATGTDEQISSKKDLIREIFTGSKTNKTYAINEREGMQAFIVNNEGQSAYMFVTRDQDVQRLYKNLTDDVYDFSSYARLKESIEKSGGSVGGVVELPKINKYDLGNGKFITTVSQGRESEKILLPQLTTSINAEGKLSAFMNDADYDMFTLWRRYGGNFLDEISQGNYDAASSMARRTFNKQIENMPSSASYRRIGDVRGMHLGPSDYMHSEEYRVMDGLKTIFNHMVGQEVDGNNLNIAQKIVYEFGKNEDINTWMLKGNSKKTINEYLNSVANSDVFDQFFTARMVVGGLDTAPTFQRSASSEALRKIKDPILEVIRHEVMENSDAYGFTDTVKRAMELIPHASKLNPVGPESAVELGSLFSVMPGEYNMLASLASTMRPLYTQQNNGLVFNADEAIKEATNSDGSFGGIFRGFDEKAIRYKTNYLEKREYYPRLALASQGIETGERNFIMKVKYMSDFELQDKVSSLTLKTKNKKFRRDIMNEFGITEEQFFKAAEVFQSDAFSLHEDKGIIAPGLKQTGLFQSREPMKYEVNVSNLDKERTMEALDKILGKRNDTVIGRDSIMYIKKDGAPVFYDGPEAIFSRTNYNTIKDAFNDDGLDIATTYLNLSEGTIVDDKMIINGNEKFTTHAINLKSVNQALGFGPDSRKSLEIANRIFSYLSDGALAILNPKSAKHGMDHSAVSDWNVITDFYAEAGKTDILADYLNSFMEKNKNISEGLERFESINNRLVGNTSFGKHNAAFIEKVVSEIRQNKVNGLDKILNEKIVAFMDDIREKNISYNLAQRQHMTEFLGKKYTMDQRTEQAMLMRGNDYSFNGGGEILESSERMVKNLRKYAMSYDGTGTGLSEMGFEKLQRIADAFNVAHNQERIKYVSAQRDMKRSIRGILEVVDSYNSKTPINSGTLNNVVQFDINDLMKSAFWNDGGVTTDELKSSFFFIDGKPSMALKQQAEKQGIDLSRDSYSIFINMHKSIKTKAGETDGLLIPIQNVTSMTNDRHYFQNQQAYTTKMFNEVLDLIKNPKSAKNKDKTIDKIYEEYTGKLINELNYMSKDADITKSLQQYALPTSAYSLGQDEVSPFLKSQTTKAFKDAHYEKVNLEKQLIENPYNVSLMEQYTKATKIFEDRLNDLADSIEKNENIFSQYTALATKHNKKLGQAMKVGSHHGMGVAIGVEDFKARGLSFAGLSMELVADIEKTESLYSYKGQFDKIVKFKKDHMDQITELKRNLNGLYINIGDGNGITLDINSNKPLMPQLEEQLGISTKTLNEAIANGDKKIGIKRVVDLFETSRLAHDYLTEVGTYGDFFRSPIFRAQPVVKVMLDESIKGRQIRILDATMSMLSNIDFDGDTGALSLILNGGSILKKLTQEWQDYNFEWNRFAKENSNKLLADLIRDGASFRHEHAYAPHLQLASLLKIADEDAYNQGLQAFLDNHDIFDETGKRISNYTDPRITKGIKFAADNSKEMASMFEVAIGNTLIDENMTLGAFAARKRKEYIGAVSTPAFRIRSTILDTMESEGITAEQKTYLNDILVGMDNMLSERGGFMAVSEQKGIDTKFARDAAKYSRLTKWAGAMTKIIKEGEGLKYNFSQIKDIIEAIGPNVYDIHSPEEFIAYADIVANTSNDTWKKAYQIVSSGAQKDFGFSTSKGSQVFLDRDAIQELWALSSFTKAARDIPELSKIYNKRYSKYSYITSIFDANADNNFDALRDQVRNTPFRGVMDVAERIKSGIETPYKKDRIYFKAGTLLDPSDEIQYFVNDGANRFIELNKNDKFLPINGKDVKYFSNSYFENQNGYYYTMIREGKYANQLNDDIMTERLYNTINKLTLEYDKDTHSLAPRTNRYRAFDKVYRDRYDPKIAKNVVSTDEQTGRNVLTWLKKGFTNIDADEINDYITAYDKMITMNRSRGQYDDGVELIKAMNRKIAEEGWKDLSGGGKPADDMYNVLMRPHVMEVFGGEENYNDFLDLATSFPNFDDKKYTDAIDSLDGKLYDISNAEHGLGLQYDRVLKERDWHSKNGVSDESLAAFDRFLETPKSSYTQAKINDLQQYNASIIGDAQNAVYDMFDDTSQMSKHFGWNAKTAQEDQIVGFGDYMGKSFSELSRSDISEIMNASVDDYSSGLSSSNVRKLRFAIEETQKALEGYEAQTARASSISRLDDGKVKAIIGQASIEMDKFFEDNPIERVASSTASKAGEAAGEAAGESAKETLKRKTIRSEFFSDAKKAFSEMGISKKTVGITAAVLAALGIINNVIHNDKVQSPLEPARTSNNNNDPYLKNKDVQYENVAPPTQSKTIYHHSGTGLNFKVNARTKTVIDAQNNAKLVGMAGGGNPSIHSYADTSGVTDNWLENKFAELAT